jgi:hypothetical protein
MPNANASKFCHFCNFAVNSAILPKNPQIDGIEFWYGKHHGRALRAMPPHSGTLCFLYI